jgi:hypothetical protein
MTPLRLAEYVRYKTRTNPTTLTNADLITLANVVKDRLVWRALEADEDLFLVPTYLNLVANQREYPLHSDLLSRIKRVEAKLDGKNYIKLYEFDLPQHSYPISTEADIVAHFGNTEGKAFFDIMRNSIWIYSGTITDVTDGLKIWLNTVVADITSMESTVDMSEDPTPTTHGIPRALHKCLGDGMVIEWKESREKPIPLTEREMMYDREVDRAVSSLKRANYDRDIIGSIPNEGNYGQDF